MPGPSIDDARIGEFKLFLRVGIPAGIAFSLFELALGVVFGDRGAFIGGVALGLYVAFILGWSLRTLGRIPLESVVRWILFAMFSPILIVGLVQPGVSLLVTILPITVAMSFLDGRDMRRVTALAVVTAVLISVMTDLMPYAPRVPPALLVVLHVSGVLITTVLVALLIWQFRARASATEKELTALVTMSRELAQTLDLTEVGNLTARYVAEAIGADECGICYWDRDADRILTYGYYPAERRSEVEDAYQLADYPLTREVLAGATVTVSDDDPAADANEIAYLHGLGQRSMVSLPLVGRGRILGAIEATSRKPAFFDERHMARIWPMATEAAMALENHRLIDELRHQAFHDPLTGLPNRNLLMDRVSHAVARRPDGAARLDAVLFLDLDDFKSVNDNLGHAGGDLLLVAVAERLLLALRAGDTAARIGGDEFAILLEDLRSEDEASHVAGRLIEAFRAPLRMGDASATIGTSIGVVVSVRGASSAEELLRNADFAMYRAKTLGKNRFEVFRPHLRNAATAEAALRERLRDAVERDELRLHYQPIVDLADGAMVGVEALLRWQLPDRPMLMPADFIPLAEESGLILPIGRWILQHACRETRAWQIRHDLPTLSVAVNLSARQFQDPQLMADVGGALRASGLDPACLTLEITESVLMQTSAATIGRLANLRGLGVRLAIDDFGTGYSSLSYLEQFPVDTLKIDKSFVDRIGQPGVKPVLARAILQLGKALGLEVVAEGIERPDQADILRRLGCGRGQGYVFSRPLPPEELEAVLHAGRIALVDEPDARTRPIPIRRGRRPAGRAAVLLVDVASRPPG